MFKTLLRKTNLEYVTDVTDVVMEFWKLLKAFHKEIQCSVRKRWGQLFMRLWQWRFIHLASHPSVPSILQQTGTSYKVFSSFLHCSEMREDLYMPISWAYKAHNGRYPGAYSAKWKFSLLPLYPLVSWLSIFSAEDWKEGSPCCTTWLQERINLGRGLFLYQGMFFSCIWYKIKCCWLWLRQSEMVYGVWGFNETL